MQCQKGHNVFFNFLSIGTNYATGSLGMCQSSSFSSDHVKNIYSIVICENVRKFRFPNEVQINLMFDWSKNTEPNTC